MEATTETHLAAAMALSKQLDRELAEAEPAKVQQLGVEDLSGQRTQDSPGSSTVYLVAFAGEPQQAFFKPVDGVDEETAGYYDADGYSAAVAEVAAVAVARALGYPYGDLVTGTVLRELNGMLGTLSWRVEGEMADPHEIDPEQLLAGALLDSLIANQDRHGGNYYYHHAEEQLGLYDHGFSFAIPGAYVNASRLLGHRLALVGDALTAAEITALSAADLSVVDELLTDERLQALYDRRNQMTTTGRIARDP